MKTVCIVVLTGLPAVGKTSLARKLYSFLNTDKNCVVQHVVFDDLVSLEEQASIAQSTETTKVFHQKRFLMKNLVESFIVTSPESPLKRIVLVDDNNYYRSMRYEYYQLAAKHSVGYLQVFVRCDVDDAISSNDQRPADEKVPTSVISQLHAKFEEPSEKWENCILLESVKLRDQLNEAELLQSVWTRIQESFSNPVLFLQFIEERNAKSEQSRFCNDRNLLHGIDKVLRRQVGKMIREYKDGSVRLFADELNCTRLTTMESIRTGDLVIPKETLTEGDFDAQKLEEWVVKVFLQRYPLL
jgi:O-phosphoseryl-tRNA(Sec) kinase